jgi:4-amino-4-deoxy-L-arabinose transferase-like glycosyltransferase
MTGMSIKTALKILYPFSFIAIILTIIWIQIPYLFTKCLWPDEALYGWYAKLISANPLMIFSKEINEFHPPFFASLLALGHLIVPHELVYRCLPFLISLWGIYLIYLIGIKIKDPFTGLCAAINLGFNFLYLSNSTRILIDCTLTVFILYFVYALLTYNSSFKKQLILCLTGSCIILLKWSGTLIIPFLLIYTLLSPSPLALKDKLKAILAPLLTFAVVALFLLLNNYFKLGHPLPDTSAIEGRYLVKPFWYYICDLPNIIIIPYLIPFFIYGLWVMIKRSFSGFRNEDALLLAWLFVFLLGISLAQEKDLRYSLLVLPSILLISCIGISTLIDTFFKDQKLKTILEILMVVILLTTYGSLLPRTERFLNHTALTYTGFQEAGRWIKRESQSNTMVLASSVRTIRYYSNLDLAQFGGQIRLLPSERSDFEAMIKNARGPVIVEIDRWEIPVQPSWLYPISPVTEQYMANQGFKLVQTIDHKIYLPDGNKQMMPVIWIFEK